MESSPLITHVSWGRIEVEGLGTGKDFKLFPGGGREWDWNEHGTRHTPGIRPEEISELLEHGASVVVLSQGMDLRLRTMPETLRLLEEAGVEVHVAETRQAVSLYDELAGTRPVAGLFHSTC